MAPLLPVTYLHRRAALPVVDPVGPTLYVAFWAVVGIACTSTITTIIYGLRLQVRKAMELGQYVLEEKLGEGGMGVVYRASHKLLRRPCAIKLLTGRAGEAADRFEREVRITAHLTHPNTIAIFDYGHTPDGIFYYAMEYLDGTTLEDLVTEFGAQSASRVVHILVQVCGVLEEAHTRGLVHRDIKPSNIMLTERGLIPDVVKVLDFGLVKDATPFDPDLSHANTLLGTPHYMAPEAILEPRQVDGRTDLYALGATAYFLLTGQHVFDGANLVDLCSQHVHAVPVAPSAKLPDIPASLDAVVLACLAKRREDRPANAATLAKLLLQCEVDEWTRDDAKRWWEQPHAWARARPGRSRASKRATVSGPGSATRSPSRSTTAAPPDERCSGALLGGPAELRRDPADPRLALDQRRGARVHGVVAAHEGMRMFARRAEHQLRRALGAELERRAPPPRRPPACGERRRPRRASDLRSPRATRRRVPRADRSASSRRPSDGRGGRSWG